MSHEMLLEITLPLDRFTLSARWETSESSLGLFGHSGAGKTALLEAIAGLRRQARGCIRVAGRTWLDSSRGVSLPPEARGVGYVPQEALLFPHRDVMGNLLSGRRRAGRAGAGRLDPERILQVLELVDLRGRDIATLSGGEKQRVALGRALSSGPDLLLLDEPLAGLDLPLRRRILSYLLRMREEFGIPTLYVSHEATEIQVLCDEVMVLADGRALACGRPEAVFTDTSILPMAREEGFENVLRGIVVEVRESAAALELEPELTLIVPARGLRAGGAAVIGLRAEDLILAVDPPSGLSAQNALPGSVREIREMAREDGQVVVVELGRRLSPIVVIVTQQAIRRLALRAGMPVHLVFKAQACRVLAARE